MRITNYKSTAEAGAILNITPRRIRQLIHDGKLPATRLGRDFFIRLADIYEFKENRRSNEKHLS